MSLAALTTVWIKEDNMNVIASFSLNLDERPTGVHVITSEAEALQAAEELRRFLEAGAAARDRHPAPPLKELDKLSESGILAITVPSAFGGAGVSFETAIRVFQLLSAGDPAVAQMTQSHYFFIEAVRDDGSAEQQAAIFGAVLAGARLGNAKAEKGGNSALNFSTRLLPDADGTLRLNGRKYYCTGALLAHWLPVAAFDEQDRFVFAFVSRHAPGVTVDTDWDAMGQRVAFSGTASFENVEVAPLHVIPHFQLFERASIFHPYGQLLHAAIEVGIAQNALADAVATVRARTRPRLGAPVERADADPHVLLRFGQLKTQFRAAELLLRDAAQSLDRARAKLTPETAGAAAIAVAAAKAYAEDAGLAITNDLFALAGTSATSAQFGLDRHWRNLRTHSVHDANQWRYHAVGAHLLTGALPGKPIRKPRAE
jgi:SfnB family sulfur acquisition oxidoreductase